MSFWRKTHSWKTTSRLPTICTWWAHKGRRSDREHAKNSFNTPATRTGDAYTGFRSLSQTLRLITNLTYYWITEHLSIFIFSPEWNSTDSRRRLENKRKQKSIFEMTETKWVSVALCKCQPFAVKARKKSLLTHLMEYLVFFFIIKYLIATDRIFHHWGKSCLRQLLNSIEMRSAFWSNVFVNEALNLFGTLFFFRGRNFFPWVLPI